VGIGKMSASDALSYGVTGPMLRASGVDWDLRKARPYMGYEQYEFNVPTRKEGDTYARYIVRIEEMRESLKIIEQALNRLPMGPVNSDNRKFVPPPRSEIGTSMESLIHHFKLWTEGFPAPKGSIYNAVESPRGELGVYLEGDGGPKPYRVHWRTPSFNNLSVISLITKGHLVADLIGILASVDIVLGDIDR
jgi:NADH-quinone oxidoreductase subunit D